MKYVYDHPRGILVVIAGLIGISVAGSLWLVFRS